MKFLPILMMALGAMIVGCERHEFYGEDGTRQLHVKPKVEAIEHSHDAVEE